MGIISYKGPKQAVETAKRILTKEKIDRQLATQSSSIPFMSVKDNYYKRVTFHTQGRLEDKIDKLIAMMGKLAAKTVRLIGHSNLRSIKVREEDKVETSMTYSIIKGGIITINIDQIVGIGVFNLTDKAEVDQSTSKIIGEVILEAIQDHIKMLEDRITEENIEVTTGMKATAEIEVGVGLEEGHFQEIMTAIIEGRIEAQVIADQGQDQEQAQTGIELDVIPVESMITLQKIVPPPMKEET